jgi:iron(III) transport system substrate-binding protein
MFKKITAKQSTVKQSTARQTTIQLAVADTHTSTSPSRIVRGVAGLVFGALFIGACGGNNSSLSQDTVDGNVDTTNSIDPSSTELPIDACANAEGSITLYSGRNENLVGDLFTQFTSETGVTIEVRYGDSGELAGQILTEGGSSPADVFFSQDAGALGAIARAELLTPIDEDLLDRVPRSFSSPEGVWIGTSGRVRVIVYNPDLVSTPPSTIDELLDPSWKGRIGFAPTNASWQSFVTALRVLRGEAEARQWLEAFAANDPVAYEKNAAVRDAVDSGEIAVGLTNHYYLYEKIAAEGAATVVAKNQYMTPGDPGGLVNVAGAGILDSSDNRQAATCFISYLVSDDAQTYFTTRSFEYPLVTGISPAEGLPEFDSLEPPSIDLSDLASIAQTQELLADVGLLTL